MVQVFWSLLALLIAPAGSHTPAGSAPPVLHLSAAVGSSVVLPCRIDDVMEGFTVAVVGWSRADRWDGYILLYTDGDFVPELQLAEYAERAELKNRVQLIGGEVKEGDLSMVLTKVKKNDGGTYECDYALRDKLGGDAIYTQSVHLTVDRPAADGGMMDRWMTDGGMTEGGGRSLLVSSLLIGSVVLLVVSVLLLLAVSFWRRNKNNNNKNNKNTKGSAPPPSAPPSPPSSAPPPSAPPPSPPPPVLVVI